MTTYASSLATWDARANPAYWETRFGGFSYAPIAYDLLAEHYVAHHQFKNTQDQNKFLITENRDDCKRRRIESLVEEGVQEEKNDGSDTIDHAVLEGKF